MNAFAIETEVAHRCREWELAVAAEARAAQAQPKQGRRRWSELSRRFLAVMRTLAKPQDSPGTMRTTAGHRMAPAQRLESGGALVHWRPGCPANEDLTTRPALKRSA